MAAGYRPKLREGKIVRPLAVRSILWLGVLGLIIGPAPIVYGFQTAAAIAEL